MGAFVLPRLVVRVGLTGHRPDRLQVSAAQVASQIASVLDAMGRVAQDTVSAHPQLYQPAPPIKRLTTGLARGTDEIGAECALQLSWQLQSVVAFDRERFVQNAVAGCSPQEADDYRARHASLLERSSSVLEVLGEENGGLRRDAYELVGETILEQADVVIGVWDGKPARGLGGSAHLMRLAHQRGLPVVWIHAAHVLPIQVYLPGEDVAQGLEGLVAWLQKSLVLHSTPDGHVSHSHSRSAVQRWQDFVQEDGTRTSRFFPFFQYLLILGGKSRPRWFLPAASSRNNWEDNWQRFRTAVATEDAGAANALDDALWKPFLRADHLAERYGRAYRGTYSLIYLLAGLATLSGLLGLILPDAKFWLVTAELFIILGMIGVTQLGRARHWHERWLEYRAIAEQLRQARMGIWTGQSLEPSDAEGDSSHAGASWASWYVRACVRQLPMINARATPDYVRKAIATIDDLEISDQRRFNESTSRVQDHVHERLEHIEMVLLVLLIAACTGFLLLYSTCGTQPWFDPLPKWMTLIGALIPALGAALLGIRSQGDFQAYAERAADTAAQLRPIAAAAVRWREPGGVDPDFQDLLDLTDRTTDALANDVFAWRMVYRRKALTVSA